MACFVAIGQVYASSAARAANIEDYFCPKHGKTAALSFSEYTNTTRLSRSYMCEAIDGKYYDNLFYYGPFKAENQKQVMELSTEIL